MQSSVHYTAPLYGTPSSPRSPLLYASPSLIAHPAMQRPVHSAASGVLAALQLLDQRQGGAGAPHAFRV